MMSNRDNVIAEVARAQGVIMTMYAMLRDMNIGNLVDEDKNGKLGDVIGDTMAGLNSIIVELDCNANQQEGKEDE